MHLLWSGLSDRGFFRVHDRTNFGNNNFRQIEHFCVLFYNVFTVFTEATNVSHADGISRHRLTPYDVHTLQYKYDN